MQRFLPVGKDAKGAARFLLAALPALGAVLTALAVTGDLVGRMARNHPWSSFGAFGCGALAVFLGAIAAFVLGEGSSEERRVLYAGLAVLGTGLVFTVYGGVRTWGDRPQPSITVTPRSGAKVAVSVKAVGLRSSDHLMIEVKELVHGKRGQPLYGASLGPNDAGVIDHAADISLPAGDFDDLEARAWIGDKPRSCEAGGNTTGCVRVHIQRPQERPQLAVTWETFVRVPRVLIRLKARNLPLRPARSMTLRVYGLAPARPARHLAEWSLAPDADGVFDRRLAVVVGRAYSDVCVVASITSREPACPAPVENGTVWSRLAVPAAQ
jgi:hypothetical protein